MYVRCCICYKKSVVNICKCIYVCCAATNNERIAEIDDTSEYLNKKLQYK